MAFAAVAALIGGAEVTAALVLSAISEVGLVTTVVGAVTGNKDLLKIGGVMGLVGGVGGLINNLGAPAVAGAVDQTAAETARLGLDNAGAVASPVVDPIVENTTAGMLGESAKGATEFGTQAMMPPADASGNALGSGFYGNGPGGAELGASPMTQGMTPAANAPSVGPTDVATPYSASTTNVPSVGAPEAPSTPFSESNPYMNETAKFNAQNAQAAGKYWGNAPEASNSWWGGLKDFVNNNKELTNNIVKVGAGVFSGIAQANQADREYNLKNNQFEYQKQQNKNSGNWSPILYNKPTGILGQAR